MLFLNIEDLSVFFMKPLACHPCLTPFLFWFLFFQIHPCLKKSKVIRLQLGSSHSKNNFEDQNKLLQNKQ